jgi:Fe-S cluster assembly iron-binding protein IscA
MPMPLKFTERAAAVLKESLHKQEREREQVIRLLLDPQGDIRLALDIPRDGDQRVEHQGDTVLVVESGICIVLSDVVVDVQESAQGRAFVLQTNSHPS